MVIASTEIWRTLRRASFINNLCSWLFFYYLFYCPFSIPSSNVVRLTCHRQGTPRIMLREPQIIKIRSPVSNNYTLLQKKTSHTILYFHTHRFAISARKHNITLTSSFLPSVSSSTSSTSSASSCFPGCLSSVSSWISSSGSSSLSDPWSDFSDFLSDPLSDSLSDLSDSLSDSLSDLSDSSSDSLSDFLSDSLSDSLSGSSPSPFSFSFSSSDSKSSL